MSPKRTFNQLVLWAAITHKELEMAENETNDLLKSFAVN